jgi:putative copper resistance protein D
VILLAGLLDVFFRALSFIGLALAVGGVAFEALILRPAAGRASPSPATTDSALRRAATLAFAGALLVTLCQAGALIVAPWALADDTGQWPLAAFLSTTFARAGIRHAATALLLALSAIAIKCRPHAAAPRLAALLLALLTLATGGPLTHGASRLTDRLLLMSVTVLHQLPCVVWVGGTLHLVAQWRLLRDGAGRDTFWPRLLARFSPLALACVAALLAAGLYLAWRYFDSPRGLLGTAYGAMLLTKIALMFAALALGGLNFLAIRDWRTSGHLTALSLRVPVLIEAEAAIGVSILMAAAALTGQPPAIDLVSQQAAPADVLRVFAPKRPQLTAPPLGDVVVGSNLVTDAYNLPQPLEKIQSNFNHNVSGACVLLAGLGALAFAAGFRPARHWPLAFIPLGLFVQLYAEPTIRPLGPEPFLATLAVPQVIMHRTASLVVIAAGLFEWRVRTGPLAHTRLRYAFPLLCLVGGALLLTHSHAAFATRWAFLVEVSHNALGTCAVLAGTARWLELRLPDGRDKRLAAMTWPLCLTGIGLVLLFYRET